MSLFYAKQMQLAQTTNITQSFVALIELSLDVDLSVV